MTHAPNTGHIVRPPRVRLAALIVLMMMTCLAYIPAQPLPPVFLEESKNCSAELLDGILSQCVDPLKASNIKSVANTLENLCLETSPCQAALRKLDIKSCARVHDFSLLVRLEEYLPEAVSLCVKDKKGTYCKAKVIDTLDSASASCPKRTDKLSCRQAPECTWLQSCLRRPRKEEMDAACGECRTLLQMREADVLGYLAAAKRINPQTYDALGLMDS